MKELLYKKSEAVAALNRVDGFHPMELARKIGEEGQEEQLYLDVKYRKLWFRLVNPAGKIISRIITFTENMAVVEARIYLDKCDQEDNYVANSFSQKFRSDDPKFGDKFLEMAETAAVGRALSDAGYGVQFADVGEENDPAQVDAGIPYQNPQMPDSDAMANAAMPNYGEMPGQPEYAGQQMMNQFYQQAQADFGEVFVEKTAGDLTYYALENANTYLLQRNAAVYFCTFPSEAEPEEMFQLLFARETPSA